MWGIQRCSTGPQPFWFDCIDLLEGCGSYDDVRESTFYLFTSKHVHRQAPELHFNRVHTSQHLFRVCYVTQHTRRWKGDGPSFFYSLAMMIYPKALEDISTVASCQFIPNLPLTVPKSAIKSANKGPWKHGFCSVWGIQRCSTGHRPSYFHYVDLVEGCGS